MTDDNFEDRYEEIITAGARELGTIAYGSSVQELQETFHILSKKLIEELDKLVPFLSDEVRFIWLTEYSETLHGLDGFNDLAEIVLQVAEFLEHTSAEELRWQKLEPEQYDEISHIMVLIHLYVRSISTTLSAVLLRDDMGEFDSPQA